MLTVMPNLAVIALFILSVCLFHLASRVIARRRQMRWRSRHDASTTLPTALAVIVTPPTLVAAVQLPVLRSRAFPLVGVRPSRAAAGSVEQLLRHLAGVTAVYVSPVTALVYLDYLPAQVTEDELVQAIQHEGYRVGDAAHRFDRRHAAHGLMGPSVP
jgi:hypothetical protein